MRRKVEPLDQRIMRMSQAMPNGCRHWTGRLDSGGYGRITLPGRIVRLAHRIAYEVFRGEIGATDVVDHQCHNLDTSCNGGPSCTHRRCVEPTHLRLVSGGENTRAGRRAASLRTACPKGHPYDDKNTYWRPLRNGRPGRSCRACHAHREGLRKAARGGRAAEAER